VFHRPISSLQAKAGHYSLSWARMIVEKFHQSHARATDAFEQAFPIDDDILAKLLADGRPEWQQIKDMIHVLERWIIKQDSVGPKPLLECLPPAAVRKDLLHLFTPNLQEKLAEYLQNGISQI
jgi:hypothetical protein